MRYKSCYFSVWSKLCILLALTAFPTAEAMSQAPQAHQLQILTAKAAEEYRLGRLKEALALTRSVAEGAKQQFGQNHLRYAQALNNLALFQDLTGALSKAEKNYRQAIEIVLALGGNHSKHLAEFKNNLATVVLQQCQINAARDLFAEGLELTVAVYGMNHRETEFVRANIRKLDSYLTGAPAKTVSSFSSNRAPSTSSINRLLESCLS